jgi:hypothetical protein
LQNLNQVTKIHELEHVPLIYWLQHWIRMLLLNKGLLNSDCFSLLLINQQLLYRFYNDIVKWCSPGAVCFFFFTFFKPISTTLKLRHLHQHFLFLFFATANGRADRGECTNFSLDVARQRTILDTITFDRLVRLGSRHIAATKRCVVTRYLDRLRGRNQVKLI